MRTVHATGWFQTDPGKFMYRDPMLYCGVAQRQTAMVQGGPNTDRMLSAAWEFLDP